MTKTMTKTMTKIMTKTMTKTMTKIMTKTRNKTLTFFRPEWKSTNTTWRQSTPLPKASPNPSSQCAFCPTNTSGSFHPRGFLTKFERYSSLSMHL